MYFLSRGGEIQLVLSGLDLLEECSGILNVAYCFALFFHSLCSTSGFANKLFIAFAAF